MRPPRPSPGSGGAPATDGGTDSAATAVPARNVAGSQAKRRAGLRRRSFVVRALRVLAPLSMAVIAAVLVGWVVGRAHKRDRSEATKAPISIHMSNPRFLGRDSRGRAYVLTGQKAVRDDKDAHLVHLDAPHLTLDSGPNRPFVVTGKTGLYHDDTHKLTLNGDVVVDDGRGNRFYSDEGEIDTDSGDVVGRSHARGEGPSGAISGDSYALSDKGDHATFSGGVKTLLQMKSSVAPTRAPSAATKGR